MLATHYRVNFEEPGGVTREELFAALCEENNYSIQGTRYLVYLRDEGAYYVGLIVLIRDQKAFLAIEGIDSPDPVLTREQLGNKQMLEFNLFVLGKTTWSALYLHYPRSCSWNKFGILCKSKSTEMQRKRRDAEIANIPPGRNKAKRERDIRNRYKTPLRWNVQLTPEDFLALVQKATQVSDFSYSASTEILQKPEFAPASISVRSMKANVAVTFKDGQTEGARKWIAAVIEALGRMIKRAKSRVVLTIQAIIKPTNSLDRQYSLWQRPGYEN